MRVGHVTLEHDYDRGINISEFVFVSFDFDRKWLSRRRLSLGTGSPGCDKIRLGICQNTGSKPSFFRSLAHNFGRKSPIALKLRSHFRGKGEGKEEGKGRSRPSHVFVPCARHPPPISVLPDPNNMLISSLNAIKEGRKGETEKEKGREGSLDPFYTSCSAEAVPKRQWNDVER